MRGEARDSAVLGGLMCAKGGSAFENVVGMAVFGATGGASPSPYEKRAESAENSIDGAAGEQPPP